MTYGYLHHLRRGTFHYGEKSMRMLGLQRNHNGSLFRRGIKYCNNRRNLLMFIVYRYAMRLMKEINREPADFTGPP